MAIFGLIRETGRGLAGRPLVRVIPVLGLLAVIGGVVWYSYPAEEAGQKVTAVPLIRADASAYKVMPAEPGGMEIAHRDSTVFETIRSARYEDGARPVENLLPPPEEPLPRAEIFAGLKAEIEAEMGMVSTVPAAEQDKADESDMAAQDAGTEKMPQPAAKPGLPPEQETAKAVEKTVAEFVAATEPAAGQAAGDFFVQLGSMRTREDAQKSWQVFQDRFPVQLEDLQLRIQEADLGERGVYYRVQAGPVQEVQAQSICRAVEEKQPGGCLVVSR